MVMAMMDEDDERLKSEVTFLRQIMGDGSGDGGDGGDGCDGGGGSGGGDRGYREARVSLQREKYFQPRKMYNFLS